MWSKRWWAVKFGLANHGALNLGVLSGEGVCTQIVKPYFGGWGKNPKSEIRNPKFKVVS